MLAHSLWDHPRMCGDHLFIPSASSIVRDHPRMCGDHSSGAGVQSVALGSPPHVRGPLHSLQQYCILVGITPACAGTTAPVCPTCEDSRDHPRMCGDHSTARLKLLYSSGSPPHVRGPPTSKPNNTNLSGITPACAGTTARRP